MRKTTLVTGGAGFIGSHFVEKLFDDTDDDVVVLDVFTYAASPDNIREEIRNSPRFRLVKGDVRDANLVLELVSGVDRVVHFAAESHVARSILADRLFLETDGFGTYSIALAVLANKGKIERLVHISTSEVYGTAIGGRAMSEGHLLNPCTPYAAAKVWGDRLVHSYFETYEIPSVIIRPFNNYGPRQHVEKVVPRFITQAFLGEPLTVHGAGLSSRDWVHVSDTCDAVYRALTVPGIEGEVFNVGTGVDTSIREVAVRVRELAGGGSEIKHVPERPGQVAKHLADASKAEVALGFKAKVDFRDGLGATVEWYRRNEAWWRRILHEREVVMDDSSRQLRGSF